MNPNQQPIKRFLNEYKLVVNVRPIDIKYPWLELIRILILLITRKLNSNFIEMTEKRPLENILNMRRMVGRQYCLYAKHLPGIEPYR